MIAYPGCASHMAPIGGLACCEAKGSLRVNALILTVRRSRPVSPDMQTRHPSEVPIAG